MVPLLLFIGLALAPADGHPQAILARDDVTFARKLNDAGFHDLARRLYDERFTAYRKDTFRRKYLRGRGRNPNLVNV